MRLETADALGRQQPIEAQLGELGRGRVRDPALGFTSDRRWTTAFSAVWEGRAELPTLAFGAYVDREDPNGPFEACDENLLYRPSGGVYRPPSQLSPGSSIPF